MALTHENDRLLLHRLLSGQQDPSPAWREFLRLYSSLFLSVIRTYEREHDDIMEVYLYVCSRLAENDCALLRKFRPLEREPMPKLSTWLVVVVRNLCVERHRSLYGRPRVPLALKGLTPREREIFILHYWKGFSAEEIHHQLGNYVRTADVTDVLLRIESLLVRPPTPRRKQLHVVPLIAGNEPAEMESAFFLENADWVDQALGTLEEDERIVVRLRFWNDLTAQEIADLLSIKPQRKVYTLLERSLKKIRRFANSEKAA